MLNVQINLPGIAAFNDRVRVNYRFYLGFLASTWGNELSNMGKPRMQLGNFTYIVVFECQSDSSLFHHRS